MQRYNKDKRATYKQHARKIKIYDTCDAYDGQHNIQRIHINIRYDTYNKNKYIADVYRKTRDTRAQTYVNITNAINDIFPSINAPHNAHTHRAICEYHKFIPQETYYTQPDGEPDTIHKDTRTVKCIIMNDEDDVIYIGMMRRTRTVNHTQGTIDITLHRGTRTMQAYERAVDLDRIIHGVKIKDIKAHDVEIYYI